MRDPVQARQWADSQLQQVRATLSKVADACQLMGHDRAESALLDAQITLVAARLNYGIMHDQLQQQVASQARQIKSLKEKLRKTETTIVPAAETPPVEGEKNDVV